MTLTSTHLEGLDLIHRGKVRETYEVDDEHLLLVATDRLSAFDVVFDQPIPDKGRLLTGLSAFWFRELASLGPTHFLSTDADQLPPAARGPELDGRVTLARRAQRIDAECVVRGYLAGSGWAEYQAGGEGALYEVAFEVDDARAAGDAMHERGLSPVGLAGEPLPTLPEAAFRTSRRAAASAPADDDVDRGATSARRSRSRP